MKPFVSARVATVALFVLALAPVAAAAPDSVLDGEKLAFDRGKGNCLSCHEIKGGDLAGTIGPSLIGLKDRYPDRKDVVGIIADETKRNPQTVMPPFGRNLILTDREIQAIADFLYSH